jgi:hypothetical protein
MIDRLRLRVCILAKRAGQRRHGMVMRRPQKPYLICFESHYD